MTLVAYKTIRGLVEIRMSGFGNSATSCVCSVCAGFYIHPVISCLLFLQGSRLLTELQGLSRLDVMKCQETFYAGLEICSKNSLCPLFTHIGRWYFCSLSQGFSHFSILCQSNFINSNWLTSNLNLSETNVLSNITTIKKVGTECRKNSPKSLCTTAYVVHYHFSEDKSTWRFNVKITKICEWY